MLVAVLAAALGVTVCSKWFADRSARNATLDHFSSTGKLCANASYPLTVSVLSQIQELSSLRLAIVATNGSDAVQLESRSNGFPPEGDFAWISGLVRKASQTNSKPSFEKIGLVDGNGVRFNAAATLLPKQQKPLERPRFLILLEPEAKSNNGLVQAFVLPLVTGLFSSILIALVATFVAARIGQRVERLSEHVQEIANGSFETIRPTGPVDAIHTLYGSVNSMSQQLRESTSQIAMNERSRLINLIASGLAHELRNHLTGARLAIQTCSPDPTTQESLSISLKQMTLAEETIQRLLTLRADAPDNPSPPMSIRQIYESVRELVQPIASHQRVVIEMVECEGSDGFDGLLNDGGSVVGALPLTHLDKLSETGHRIQGTQSEDVFGTMYEDFLATVERPMLQSMMEALHHNRALIATQLGMHRSTLRQKMRRYEID
jgi:HAMP domain-containing protein